MLRGKRPVLKVLAPGVGAREAGGTPAPAPAPDMWGDREGGTGPRSSGSELAQAGLEL